MLRTRDVISLLIFCGLTMSVSSSLAAQEVPEHRLSQPQSGFPEPFSLVQGVRELSNGAVMVADPLSQVVLLADLAAGVGDTLGHVGQGPGEYRQPDALFPLPGDSTLLVDLGNGRLSVLGPDGRFGETMPIGQEGPGELGGLLIVLPRGVDAAGNLYIQPFGGGPGGRLPDSAAVVRLDRGSGALDTVARVKLPDMVQHTGGGRSERSVTLRPRPLSPQDAWAVAPDGRIAVARPVERRVEWIHPDGRRVRSDPIPYDPIAIRDADKQAWLDAQANGLRVGVSIENGQRRMAFGRGGGGQRDADSFDWPDHKPIFTAGGVWVAPDGDMWVRRHVPAGDPVRFDVFGRDARLKAIITLPPDREIVGFGAETVYTVRIDDLGLQYLEQHRRPTS